MLVARRDPQFHAATRGAALPPPSRATHAPHSSHSTRFMTALQMIGTVLAIPLGLASGYSIYKANFSVEAQCQGLRANIVSMLDKSADASTLRMLVRRDVVTFEKSCGSVDPDAVKAFKTLLVSAKPAVAPKTVAREPIQAPIVVAKPKAVAPAVADSEPVARENATADANWLAAVRGALTHAPNAPAKSAANKTESVATRVPAPPARPLGELRAAPAPGVVSVPALPPAASVAAAPAPAADGRHPVPPASIPDSAPLQLAAAAPPAKPARSGITGLLADIPLLGRLVSH
jgi:hypothetical protein